MTTAWTSSKPVSLTSVLNMRTYQPYARRSRLPVWILGGITTLLLLGGGVVTTFWLLGWFSGPPAEDPYMVRIPINAVPIPAYSRVDRSHLLNPQTGSLIYQQVPPTGVVGLSIVGVDAQGSHAEGRVDAVKNVNNEVVFVLGDKREIRQAQTFELGGAMMNVNRIIGRVVKRDKRVGMGFSESLFFPQGTPEGIAGATPEGMRAITLDATKLIGVHSLHTGDVIDLLATLNAAGSSADDASSEPMLLAQSAVVLKPVYVRNEASTSASLTQGTRIQNVPKYEVAIAIQPDDIIPLQSALNQSTQITCIAHSMQPELAGEAKQLTNENNTVSVPVTVRPILGYEVVSREAFISAATRTLKTIELPAQEASRFDVITSVNEALGAIAKHDIPAGSYLRRSDLLSGPPRSSNRPTHVDASNERNDQRYRFVSTMQEPSSPAPARSGGAGPAISSFVPAGMRAFSIPWNRVFGSEHLQIGDEIDLMVSYTLQRKTTVKETESRPDGTVIRREYETLRPLVSERTNEDTFGNRGEPWFVATNAIVIGPVGFPPPAPALRALVNPDPIPGRAPADKADKVLGGPPLIIAVSDQDAENLAAALVSEEALFSIAIQATENEREGMKKIAICPTNIESYERFDESVWKNNRRRIVTRYVDESDPRFATALGATEIERYFGYTLVRAKARWDFFVHEDFAIDPSVKPGVAAAVTPHHTVTIIDENLIDGLVSFATDDRVCIVLSAAEKLPMTVQYAGLDREFPTAEVVVANARVIRRSVQGKMAIELRDCDTAVLQAAIALVSKDTPNKKTGESVGNTTGNTKTPKRLVAIGLPRQHAAAINTAVPERTVIPSFDAFKTIQLMELITGERRVTFAFDKVPGGDQCQ